MNICIYYLIIYYLNKIFLKQSFYLRLGYETITICNLVNVENLCHIFRTFLF